MEGAGGFTIDSDAHSAGRQLGSPASVGTITQTIHVGGHSCHRARANTAMPKHHTHCITLRHIAYYSELSRNRVKVNCTIAV